MEKIRARIRKIFSKLPWLKSLSAFFYERLPLKWRWHIAQEAELQFHHQDTLRPDTESFDLHAKNILSGFGYSEDDMKGKTVLDVGAGSKLMSKFFRGSAIIVIEPLADKFRKELAWNDLHLARKVYSLPAEVRIAELASRADFIMCINALDHTNDPLAILKNCHYYLKTGGSMLLSVDLHKKYAGLEHPIHFENSDKLKKYCLEAGFAISREFGGMDQIGVKSYGDGMATSLILIKS